MSTPETLRLTHRDLIARLQQALTPLYGEREARSIALLCAEEFTSKSLAALLTDPQGSVEISVTTWEAALQRLSSGFPVQYFLGSTEFFGHRFAVRPGVLIPRPETEELVDWILRAEPLARTILDVGTGSGCIAASLALGLPEAAVFAADISDEALTIASENCRTLGARVTLRKADALNDLEQVFPERFEVIVSNPPYVPERDREAMHTNVREHEPALALFVPDNDPIRFYRAIARSAKTMLRPGGKLYFEIYEHAADPIVQMLSVHGFTHTEVRSDLHGKPRMICSRLP